MTLTKNDPKILCLSEVLQQPDLCIPEYQRPYKWAQKNIHALFQDIEHALTRSEYRLGTLVFHQKHENGKNSLDIVDGQQRTLTMLLAIKALIDHRLDSLESQRIKQQLLALKAPIWAFMERQHFTSDISKTNLQQNYQALTHRLSRATFTEAHIKFLLTKCTVAAFVLGDISEAFQFFDSQNARGKDLEPHDLLKAFHLREFAQDDATLKAETVTYWESLTSQDLSKLFGVSLYRIKQWSEGQKAPTFSKNDIGVFKGITLEKTSTMPYTTPLRMAHTCVDEYNHHFHRKIDHAKMVFPFQLDQFIINGRRFFEMVKHYHTMVCALTLKTTDPTQPQPHTVFAQTPLSELATRIIKTLQTYSKRHRTGDQYVKSLFECALLFYFDKFGTVEFSNIIEKLFIWAYTCRLSLQSVRLASLDKYALEHNIFYTIRKARSPYDVLAYPLKTLRAADHTDTQTTELVNLFKEMHFYVS